MLGVAMKESVEQRLEELNKDRRWLCEQTGIEESVLSRLLNDKINHKLPYLIPIEDALGLRRGHFLRQAGFVADDSEITLEQMISYDPRLSIASRTTLLEVLRSMIVAELLGANDSPTPLREIESSLRTPQELKRAAKRGPKTGQ